MSKDPKRIKAGRKSRRKGSNFERVIAQEMREIYDSPKLLAKLDSFNRRVGSDYRRLLKSSNVRRSDQGRGAKEPDLVIEGCPCWLELQDAAEGGFNPLVKLKQAERDVSDSNSDLWPVSVCHLTNTPRSSIVVAMRLRTLISLGDLELPAHMIDGFGSVIVKIGYEDFKQLLKDDYERRS